MPLPTNFGAYSDITALLNQCIASHSGAALRFETPGKATRWRQRAYYMRKLHKADMAAAGIVAPISPYDSLQFLIDLEDRCKLTIEHNYVGKGILKLEYIPIPESPDAPTHLTTPLDPLEIAAAELIRKSRA